MNLKVFGVSWVLVRAFSHIHYSALGCGFGIAESCQKITQGERTLQNYDNIFFGDVLLG